MRILVVGMADSVHLARWLKQFQNSEIDFSIVSASPHRKIHPGISSLIKGNKNFQMSFVSRYFSLPMWLLDRILSDLLRATVIAVEIKRFKPDILHVNEIQNAGYATRQAFRFINKDKPKLIVTNYGSEIIWFSRFKRHKKKITELLCLADGFSAECERDYLLASNLAPNLKMLPLIPVAGGLVRFQGISSERNLITIKGYENKWGKAIAILDLLSTMSDELVGYKIAVYSCSRKVLRKIRIMRKNFSIEIIGYKKGSLRHSEVLALFQRSKLYIGHSLSDGISTSMLEAMAMGAIPIQTCTSCADEWIISGTEGFLVKPFDREAIRSAVSDVISGKFDSDVARKRNFNTIDERYDPGILSTKALDYYLKVADE